LAAQLSQGLQAALRGGNAGMQPQMIQQQHPEAQSRIDPEAYRLYVKSNPDMMQQLLQNDPELAQAVISEDKSKLANLLNHRAGARQRAEIERRRLENMLENDPFNLELQRKIEEIIQQEQIDSNMEMAMEHNPESFGRVVMLYIDSEVNGTKLKAFVDSGAQQTIMSADCAKRCGYGIDRMEKKKNVRKNFNPPPAKFIFCAESIDFWIVVSLVLPRESVRQRLPVAST
jgi:hypothetical protein